MEDDVMVSGIRRKVVVKLEPSSSSQGRKSKGGVTTNRPCNRLALYILQAGYPRLMAVNGARITARWELMREWLKRQTRKWDLAKEFDYYKTVALAEASLKGVTPPSFKDAPTISPAAGMEVNLSVKPDGSST